MNCPAAVDRIDRSHGDRFPEAKSWTMLRLSGSEHRVDCGHGNGTWATPGDNRATRRRRRTTSRWPRCCTAMRVPQTKKRLLLRTPTATRARAHAVARWARALVPAVTLVITPYEGQRLEGADDEDAIVLDMDDVAAGPLSLANAIAKALRPER
jgi:hypothetical protein